MPANIVTLVLLLLAANCNNDRQLSPLIPPTAFAGLYYTCQFRVLGADFPKYQFEGLPPPLTWTPGGRIQGTPKQIGSYPVTVTYEANGKNSSTEFVLRVIRPIWTPFNTRSPARPAHLLVYLEHNNTIFMLGDEIYIKAGAVGGKPPYIWTYLRMPSDLSGDRQGAIRGILSLDGSYTFGVSCSDKEGNSGDLFVTLNIQPMTFFGKYNINPVYVENRKLPAQLDWKHVFQGQSSISGSFAVCFNQMQDLEIKYRQMSILIPEFRNAVVIAQAKAETAIAAVNYILEVSKQASLQLANAEEKLYRTNSSYQRALTALTEQQAHMNATKNNAQAKQDILQKANATLQAAGDGLIRAQTATGQASRDYQARSLQAQSARLDLDYSIDNTFQAKKQLQNSKTLLQLLTTNVSMVQNDVAMARLDAEDARSLFDLKEKGAKETTEALRISNLKVTEIRDQKNKLKTELEVAKFSLITRENELLVAQSTKKQADKLYQTALLMQKKYLLTSFAGCQQLNYPSFAGTGQAQQLLDSGVRLSSGQLLLWGDCTTRQDCRVGDIITFEGYLKGGSIHALTLSTVTVKS